MFEGGWEILLSMSGRRGRLVVRFGGMAEDCSGQGGVEEEAGTLE